MVMVNHMAAAMKNPKGRHLLARGFDQLYLGTSPRLSARRRSLQRSNYFADAWNDTAKAMNEALKTFESTLSSSKR
jgi:hypothetical protein